MDGISSHTYCVVLFVQHVKLLLIVSMHILCCVAMI